MSLPLSPRRRPRRETLTLLGGLATLSALAVLATALFWPRHDSNTAHPADIRGRPRLDAPITDTPISAQTIDTVNPDALFWEMFHRQATQPTVHTRRETFRSPQAAESRRLFSVEDDRYDHRTDRYVGTQVENWRGKLNIVGRCIDSTRYSRDTYDTRWVADRPDGMCRMRPFLGDGFIPSGMTAEQAEHMISSILRYPDFLHAGRPSLAEVGGQQYIRLPVRAQSLDLDGEHWGMQILTWAFNTSGLDINTHGYTTGNPGDGAEMVYYLDPETLLPAYTQRQNAPPPGKRRKPMVNRVEYVRPAEVPNDPLADITPHELSWPPDVR